MKTSFVLELKDDMKTENALKFLNRIEVMFDDVRNTLPKEWYWFTEELPLGSKVKFTMEVINDNF